MVWGIPAEGKFYITMPNKSALKDGLIEIVLAGVVLPFPISPQALPVCSAPAPKAAQKDMLALGVAKFKGKWNEPSDIGRSGDRVNATGGM